MSVLLLASAALAFLPRPLALTLDAKEGERFHGERTIHVSVASDAAINNVEMYVNGELRDNDTSTPYEFKVDTVGEEEGPLKLRFKAYTVESKTAEKTIAVVVDNEVAKGAAYHVDKANELLADAKYADARDEGKIALKAEKGNFGARVALARAYLGLGELDQAQLQAEEATTAQPDDSTALDLLAGIDVRRALNTTARPDADRAETLKNIGNAYKAAVGSRVHSLNVTLDATPKDPVLAYADAAIRAHRYSAAIAALAPAFAADQKNAAVADRLAFAQLRANRRQDAVNTLNALARAGSLSAYGFAVKAVALADAGDDDGSDAAMREAVLADSEDLGVRTAQAYIALKRGKTDVVSKLGTDLQKEQGQRADVRYFQMALAARGQNYSDAGRSFAVGVLAEPAAADLYVEYANDAIAITQRGNMAAPDKANHYAEARVYFEAALVARPEASEALAGLAMVAVFENKPAEAVRYASAAVAAAPQNPGAYYALSAAQNVLATLHRSAATAALDRHEPATADTENRAAAAASAASQTANLKAGRLDVKYLGGRGIPDAPAVWRYLDTAGRPIVLAAPSAPVAAAPAG